MTWHVVCLAGADDNFKPRLKKGDDLLVVPFGIPGHPDSVQSSLPRVLAKYSLALSAAPHDLLNAAIAAYTADVRVPRSTAFESWTRDIQLYLSVRNPRLWSEALPVLEQLLCFLTGDRWKVKVRKAPKSYTLMSAKKPRKTINIRTNTVCLFSGGLDSFIGAVNEIEKSGCTTLVGHHSAGGGATSRSQDHALSALRTAYSEDLSPFLQFWISPPKGQDQVSETSTRGRSILFLSLGVAVATALSARGLVIPENGLISLNVPLTDSRLGSYTTRTTHPFVIFLMRKLMGQLKIDLDLSLPCRFQTKGEMISNCLNQGVIKAGLKATMSCSHPSANRFTTRNPNMHCGYCIPCLIRRAAIRSALKRDPTDYAVVDLSKPLGGKRGSDIRAMKLALDRYRTRPPRVGDLLVAGSLPAPDNELREYLGVFSRGLTEVRKFLARY